MVALRPRIKSPLKTGFTLVELSIVLVIIGLIIGGVLVGRDLIAAASLRALISQKEKFETATNTFVAKYGALPGDMPPAAAADFGFFTFNPSVAGLMYHGDGDGQFQSGGFCAWENLVFWRHLSDAKLIEGQYGTIGAGNLDVSSDGVLAGPVTDLGLSFPLGKTGRGHWMMVYSTPLNAPASNYFYLSSYTTTNTVLCWPPTLYPLTPIQTQSMDAKLDDGRPETGRMIAIATNWLATPASGKCTYSGSSGYDTATLYNTTATGGEEFACDAIFKY